MSQAQTEPKLFLPFLQPLYDKAVPLSWLIVRVAVGWNLLVHGWGKIMIGATPGFLKGFADLGFTPPEFWFWSSFLIEMLGGISLILGLFTRFFAAAAATTRSSEASKHPRTSNRLTSIWSLPASIFEKSRMSLMISSSASPDV